ncbi:hypothetical protein [Marispirochaeta sp.]|uniref:hypothetical protein n=1 Tax=Marispirochaeta sp. TaxID=2038653 RepID=UPI0029C76287|nr:hypothetical protein [Marispirochaeta sp.]
MDLGILTGIFNLIVGFYFFTTVSKMVKKNPKKRFTTDQISKAYIFIRVLSILIIFFGLLRLILVVI